MTALISLPDHRVVRVLEDNADLRRRAEATITHPTEFLQLDIGDGVVMDAWMIKPRDFDRFPQVPGVHLRLRRTARPDRPRPLVDAEQLPSRDRGPRVPGRVHRESGHAGAEGSRVAKGALSRPSAYESTEEHAAGVREMGRMLPYVDVSRVGIWGWSGGGSNTLNSLFRRPDVYHVGIAVVPKPQPHLYNAWFQEIYMETLETNPEGYRVSAPINYAEGLEGDLLIIHGTGETNTHLEIVEGLVDRLGGAWARPSTTRPTPIETTGCQKERALSSTFACSWCATSWITCRPGPRRSNGIPNSIRSGASNPVETTQP